MPRETITRLFREVYEDFAQKPAPQLSDESVLLETGLDSLGFAVLVTRLQEELGYDPFTLAADAVYPRTFGQFVAFYETHAPRSAG